VRNPPDFAAYPGKNTEITRKYYEDPTLGGKSFLELSSPSADKIPTPVENYAGN